MKTILASLFLIAALTPPGATAGQPRPLTAEEAAAQAQRSYGGKVLDIRRGRDGHYRVKILKDGRVRVIDVRERQRRREQ